MTLSHLSDDRLIEACLDGVPDDGTRRHLDVCLGCDARRRELAQLLSDCAVVADLHADAAFTDERLARQQARILQRIEQDGRPARVITFPAAHAGDPAVPRRRPTGRWLAAAAAAGLIIGLVAGQMVENGLDMAPLRARSVSVPPAMQAQRPVVPAGAFRTVATTMSDEELLLRVDSVTDRSGGSALGPLDELTPRVWDVAAR